MTEAVERGSEAASRRAPDGHFAGRLVRSGRRWMREGFQGGRTFQTGRRQTGPPKHTLGLIQAFSFFLSLAPSPPPPLLPVLKHARYDARCMTFGWAATR
eukprot:354903-Chlamydomonas_euryale.AAC.38